MEATSVMASELGAVLWISKRALDELELEPVEMEFSLMSLEPLAELAAGDEVVPTDVDDPAGGFGGVDLLVTSVVPAVSWVLAELRGTKAARSDVDDLLRRALPKVEEAVRRTGSPRAADCLPRLMAIIHKVILEHLLEKAES